jgi:DinB superfamily
MDETFKKILWQQFGAAIQMLENAMHDCPDEVWGDQTREPQFWYLAYHTLFWLDFGLSESPDGFAPPAPFGLEEFDFSGVMPDRVYTKAEMQTYLEHGREKTRAAVFALTDEKARARFQYFSHNFSILELMLDHMRHVQHHTAQLNLLLRQRTDSAPQWVSRLDPKLEV